MSKSTLGVLILAIAVVNMYWAARIYTLMRATEEVEYVQACKAEARRLSRFSKASCAIAVAVGAFYVFLGR